MVTLRGAVSLACAAILGSAVFSAQETPRPARRGTLSVEADLIRYQKVGGRVVSSSGRYYRAADGRVREDIGGQGFIIDLSARTITHLTHETRQARVVTLQGATAPTPSPSAATRVGMGMHEGRRITKSRMQGPSGTKGEVWMDEVLGLAVLMRTESASLVSTQILRNITLREPDAAVFAVPAGYDVSNLSILGLAALDVLGRGESSPLSPRAGRPPYKTGRR